MANEEDRIQTARINARQAIIVAAITGIVSIITTLIATGNLLPDRTRGKTLAGGGASVPGMAVLAAPHLYFSSRQIDPSLERCMQKARDSLERAGLSGQESRQYFSWGYANETTGLIWCHTDEGVVIFLAAGRDEGAASRTAEALRRSF